MGVARQMVFEEIVPGPGKRRVQGGIATSDVVVSAYCGGNAEVFPHILGFTFPQGP